MIGRLMSTYAVMVSQVVSAAYDNQALVRLLSYMYRPLCFVLFCIFSSPPNHAEFRTWTIKMPLSQAKLFKPPVVLQTISIIQKTFLPTGVS